MSKLLAFVLFVLFSSVTAEDQWKGWTLSPESEQPEKSIRIEKNQLIAESHSENAKRKYYEISAQRPLVLQKGINHCLYAVIDAEKGGAVLFDYKYHAPYKNLGLHSIKKLIPGENRIFLSFFPKECPADKTSLVSIDLGRINGKVTVREFAVVPEKILPLSLVPDTWKAEYNGTIKEIKAEKGIIDLRKAFGAQPEGSEAVLTATFSSESYGVLPIGLSADWRMEVFANGNLCYSTLKRGNAGPKSPKTHRAEIPVYRGENTLKIRVLSGALGWSFLYGETIRTIYPEQTENWWRESVPIKNTVIKGSSLDLSGIAVAEKNNVRIIYSPIAGGYAYEDDPAKLIRFFSAEALPRPIFVERPWVKSEEEAKKELDLWAQSLKRRGYSSVRMHTLDNSLCHRSGKDMEIDPIALDRIMYSFACLKREGIRLHLTILAYSQYSSWKRGYFNHSPHKIGFMFLNDSDCERFRYGAEKLLNTVNPYTGKRLIDDPLLISIELSNEMDACCDPAFIYNFCKRNKQKEFAPLKEKINTAWLDFLKRKGVPERPLPKVSNNENDLSENASLFYEFHAEQLDRAFQWGEKVLRDMGWRGVIVNNSQSKRIGYGVSRWRTAKAVEAHGYFAHPSKFTQPGSQNYQRSSIEGFAEQFRSINSVRQYGRGFQVGEFNHAFWNRYIHEGGIVYPALAAFQGHQIICFFRNPYMPRVRRKEAGCFDIYANPVMMANGFLGAVLFGRGDVKPARHQGVLNIPSSYWKKGNTAAFPINSEQSKIALMTGLSITFPDEKPADGTAYSRKPDFALSPAKHGIVNSTEWTSNLKDVDDGSFDLAAYTAGLKKRGIIPADNLSDPKKGIFQTDTGEIILNGPEKKMTIITPRTEAISWERNSQEKLGKLFVSPAKGHATIAVSSVDGKDLADSSRIVLIFSTEAINSEMKLSEDWTKLFSNGNPPILVRTGECKAELQAKPGSWKLYALGLDGERLEELPLENENGKLTISFDTAKLKHGVTPFFELLRQ